MHIDWKDLVRFPSLLWYDYLIFGGISISVVLFAGLCSGLTLGLLSIDKLSLDILLNAGTDKEKKYARKLKPILRRYHLLLVTLLLWNALAMEALPLFLNRMVPEFLAILLSVSFVLIFGEVLPQAVISRYGLAIGGNLSWLVHILIIVALPVALPVSFALDWMLGADNENTYYKRAELKELVSIHAQPGAGGILSDDEIAVIRGALELKEKKVESIVTPINHVYMLSLDQKMDENLVDEILKTGHSRVPVYRGNDRQDIVGLLLIKNLIKLNPTKAVPVSQLELRELNTVAPDTHLWDVLNMFKSGKRSHMALVRKWITPAEQKDLEIAGDTNSTRECIIGIVTLEDVFEELIQKEIVDETDVFVNVERQEKVADMFRRITSTIKKKPSLLRVHVPPHSPSKKAFLIRNYGTSGHRNGLAASGADDIRRVVSASSPIAHSRPYTNTRDESYRLPIIASEASFLVPPHP